MTAALLYAGAEAMGPGYLWPAIFTRYIRAADAGYAQHATQGRKTPHDLKCPKRLRLRYRSSAQIFDRLGLLDQRQLCLAGWYHFGQ